MNAKNIFLEMLEGKTPERYLSQYEHLSMFLGDPVNNYLYEGSGPGLTSVDRWGVTKIWPEGAPGGMPLINEETKVLKDITHWRDYVKAPDLKANCSEGWEEAKAAFKAQAGEDKLATAFMGTGLFEQCHFLMGFEDCLTALYEHPDEMHELIDYVLQFRLEFAKMLIDKLEPDVLFTHDDWGTRQALFMSPETWREFFKEPYTKFYGYIRSRGVIAIHHGDSFCAPIVGDMIDCGIQCWQGALPENDIPALRKEYKGKMVFMGGIGAAIDTPDSTEEEITSYVRQVLEENAPGDGFIPCLTYGLYGSIYPHVNPIIEAEIDRYNEAHKNEFKPAAPAPVRRLRRAASEAVPAEKVQTVSVSGGLDDIAEALKKGQKKRVVELVEQNLNDGVKAADILEFGLLKGMNELGDKFSAGDAFVPELLMSARCMNEATKILKDKLTEGSTGAHGKAVLGTVKGDMHDIGKNLVKIMMEGCGLEVIDLGVNVSAEEFVQAAKDNDCRIIACSSLLTTSMNEMKNVVTKAVEAGIRDKVKILVGGAPITQSFCDEIGADVYTEDASKAAKTAAALCE